MAVDDWALVNTQLITLTPGEEEVGEWKNVATLTITLVPGEEEIAEWKNVATLEITLIPGTGEIDRWKLVDTKTITLTVPTIECSTDADCPEGYICVGGLCVPKEGFPGTWLAIGGATALAAVLIISAKQKGKKK